MTKIYNLICAAAFVCLGINQGQAQCISPTQYPSGTTNISAVGGSSTTVTTCNYGGEYSVDNFPTAGVYTITSNIPTDYITVTNNVNTVLPGAFGLTTLTVNIPAPGIYRIHIAAAGPPACTTQNACRTVIVVTPIIPCVAPVASTIIASNPNPCPGNNVTLSANVTYTGSVISYQWNTSTVSATGPFVAVPGATLSTYSVLAPTVTTWYNMNITCSVGPSSIAATAVSLSPAVTTTNSVPYFEGFEGITTNNQLPNCSWAASNLPTICRTYTAATGFYNQVASSGNKYASFRYGTNATGDYFYTNGIQLNAGVTYSASVRYITDGLAGWSEINMLVGNTQTTSGLTSIASATGALTNTVYATLTNTFNVASSGIYFIAIKCVGTSNPWYLTWDDLSITAPCSVNTPSVSANTPTTSICAGNSATLTASGASSYLWSNASTLTAIPVSPSVTTSYTVTGTNIVSCTNTAVVTLTVNPNATVSIANASVCGTATGSLTANATGGNPPYTYMWSNGSTLTTVSNLTPGVYSSTVTTANGCKTQQSGNVISNPNPSISIAGSTAVCAGSSATLTASGANTYTWNNGPTSAANAVSPTVTTVYTATGTSAAGCIGTTSVSLNVNASPVISIAGSSAVCAGSSATLIASGAPTFSWNTGATTTSISVTPTANATYTAMGTSSAGCVGMSAQSITVNALPSVSLSAAANTICINGGTIALTGSPAGGVFTGSNVAGNVFSAGANSGTFMPMYAFTNTVTGCANTTSTSIIVSLCTNLDSKSALVGLSAYPNPNNGVFTIELANGLNKAIEVMDLTGRKVLNLNSDKNSFNVNLSNLANGVYYVKVISNNNSQVLKVVKQ